MGNAPPPFALGTIPLDGGMGAFVAITDNEQRLPQPALDHVRKAVLPGGRALALDGHYMEQDFGAIATNGPRRQHGLIVRIRADGFIHPIDKEVDHIILGQVPRNKVLVFGRERLGDATDAAPGHQGGAILVQEGRLNIPGGQTAGVHFNGQVGQALVDRVQARQHLTFKRLLGLPHPRFLEIQGPRGRLHGDILVAIAIPGGLLGRLPGIPVPG